MANPAGGICSRCDSGQLVSIGKVRIVRLRTGKFWLAHEAGEGLETTEEKLAVVIERFFNREF